MMAVVHKYSASGMGSGTSYGAAKANDEHFPVGMRVLVVDDDTTCLKLLERMLQSCSYNVTTCPRATTALSLLRENKGAFDLVISDVHMPDMDGFKLLELVGLEMDLPVIMMSADGRTSLVMRGIRHGACDYLLKPVRMEELKNIWQHVVRKRFNENKDHENSGSLDESDRQKKAADENEYASTVNDGTDSSWKAQKKKRDAKDDDDDGELDNDDPSASKKPRVVWSVELHQQFVSAVNQLGIDKAVPKRILELMNVPGLTRENVASHLQKFRLYLKRLSGVAQHPNVLPNSYCGSIESNSKVNSLSRLDIQALAASGQLPSQLVAYQAEMLGRPSGGMVLPHLDQPHLLQASVSGPKYIPGVSFGPPLIKCQSNLSKQFSQSYPGEDVSPGFATWSPSSIGPSPVSSLTGLNNLHSSNVLAQMLPPQQTQSVISDPSHGINNVQPSCLVVPSQSSNFQGGSNLISTNPNALIVPTQSSLSYQIGNNTAHINQTSSYAGCNTLADYSLMSSQPSHAPLGIGQGSNGDLKSAGLLNGYSLTGPVSSSVSPSLISTDGSSQWTAQNSISNINSCRLPGPSPSLSDILGKELNIEAISGDVQLKNFGFVGKGTSIPSRYAVDDIELPTDDLNQRKSFLDDGTKVKQEVNLDFMDGSKVGNLSHFPPSDFMSVLSK